MLDQQLFDRFLRNECSPDERRVVSDYLATHPEEAASLLPEEEFEETQPARWDPQRSDRAFGQIEQRLHHHTSPLMRWSLVAATILMISVGIKWLTSGTGKPAQVVKIDQTVEDEWITEVNDAPHTRLLLLPDGSSAELSPGSRISYRRNFTKEDRRIVKLDGEGQFNVTTNPGRPFLVVSEELTTTVLGTWFSVTADRNAPTIKVHLYSGKVKVGMTSGIRWNTKDSSLYLQPGEELTYNKQKMLAVVHSLTHEKDPGLGKNKNLHSRTTVRSQQLTASAKPEWYNFGGQPLTEVFDQLSDYYGVQINYFPADVENHYFTGKFSKNDSLADILNDIALLHGLTLTKKDGLYVFRKKDH